MKITKILAFILIIVSCSYASLWYGFAKGYEYRLGDNLAESVITVSTLKLVRAGETNKAIESLESTLDTNIVSRQISDKNFIHYIAGLPTTSDQTTNNLESKIIKYRQETNYQCDSAPEVCELINGFLNANE